MIQADGGTRTASITGGYVALALAFRYLQQIGAVTKPPLGAQVSAISCGISKGQPVLDLDYDEDSHAEADANFVLHQRRRHRRDPGHRGAGALRREGVPRLLRLARNGCASWPRIQRKALGLG